VIPKCSFAEGEGRLLGALLWFVGAFFVAILIFVWIAAARARPVLLDLETGRPVAHRPAL